MLKRNRDDMEAPLNLMKKYALAFGISIGLTLLLVATLLLIYAPDQTSYVLTIVGILCSCVSMFFLSADVRKDKRVTQN